jgi:UDP-N-acetylmuramoyl-tripeptide--D-alanyl-D-alanine ligase
VLAFAASGPADVRCDASWSDAGWRATVRTPRGDFGALVRVAGRHNLKNALAATACAVAAGCPLAAIARGLEAFEPVAGRSQLKRVPRADASVLTLVDDSYNANPDSVRAAIDVLAELPAPRWLVLGDMGEVGDRGPEFHREVGAYARERGIESLWTAGALCTEAAAAFGSAARAFAGVDALLAALPEAPRAASAVVKGSRFMKMERVVAALGAGAAQQGSSRDAA